MKEKVVIGVEKDIFERLDLGVSRLGSIDATLKSMDATMKEDTSILKEKASTLKDHTGLFEDMKCILQKIAEK